MPRILLLQGMFSMAECEQDRRSSEALLPLRNLVATVQPPANDASNDILHVWLGSRADNAGTAMGVHPPPRADKDRAALKRWLPAEQIIAVAVGGWVVADKAQGVRKLSKVCHSNLISVVGLRHGRPPYTLCYLWFIVRYRSIPWTSTSKR
jgi:hypothetical protein